MTAILIAGAVAVLILAHATLRGQHTVTAEPRRLVDKEE